MNKAGFTLVEVLASIAILVGLMLIAIPSYNVISRHIKENQYKNKIQYIETAAEKYGNDTHETVVYVDTLVKKGYISSDDEHGNIFDPRDEERILNCYIVNIFYENENYYASFSGEEGILADGTCDIHKLNSKSGVIDLKVMKAPSNDPSTWEDVDLSSTNGWLGSNAGIKIEVKNEIKEYVKSIVIQSGFVTSEERTVNGDFDLKNTIFVESSQIVNSEYHVTIKTSETSESGNIEKVYAAKTTVKIDKQRPILYDEELHVERQADWSNMDKMVKVYATDQSGSGISGYSIGTDNHCQNVTYEDSEENFYFKEMDQGTYYVCVKDKVGNLSEDVSTKIITVENIDKIAPSCIIEVNGTKGTDDWYTSDVSFRLVASDHESGISGNFISKDGIKYETKGEVITGKVYDKAGNEGVCTATIRVDKTNPTCNISVSGTKKNIVFSISAFDVVSGIKSKNIDETRTKKEAIAKGTVYDYAGNKGTCEKIEKIRPFDEGQKWEFNYTGGVQTFKIPWEGVYRFEVYGAEGGTDSYSGGQGGYASGYKYMQEDTNLYLVIGGRGTDLADADTPYNEGGSFSGGYNGGGSAISRGADSEHFKNLSGGSGGGATHIATTNRGTLNNYASHLSELLIVAGGGGGGATEGGSKHSYRGKGYPGCGGTTINSGAAYYVHRKKSGSKREKHSYYSTTMLENRAATENSGFAFGHGEDDRVGGGGGLYGGYTRPVVEGINTDPEESGDIFRDNKKGLGAGGGSGYTGGVPSFKFNGVTYSPNGSCGGRRGHGFIRITFVAD